jgi:hypothetical protein
MTKAIPTPRSVTGAHIPDTARSEHDSLPFPGKRNIGEIKPAELTRLLQSWGIELGFESALRQS